MKNYLICYDISDQKRLYKICKIAYTFAFGGQKSAVFAPLDKDEIANLGTKFSAIIDEVDKINIIEVCDKPQILGRSLDITFYGGAIIL